MFDAYSERSPVATALRRAYGVYLVQRGIYLCRMGHHALSPTGRLIEMRIGTMSLGRWISSTGLFAEEACSRCGEVPTTGLRMVACRCPVCGVVPGLDEFAGEAPLPVGHPAGALDA